MQFSIGDIFAAIDKTLLNPLLTIPLVAYIHFFTNNKVIITPGNGLLPYSITTPLPPLIYKSLWLAGTGLVLRMNRSLSKKALNNGVKARFDWDREIIVVTGGSGGIGAVAAQKLATRGSTVVVLDVIPLTFSKRKSAPTCVVANAGICRGKSIFEASQRDIELTFGVNNLGLLWTAKTFLPAMAKADHGHFLIIASQTGHLATAGIVDYGATKAACIAIYEGLQTEMKHYYKAPSVRISCISPSAVKTKMFDGIKDLSNFFLPTLNTDDVGGLIAETLWKGEAVNKMIPAGAYISVISRMCPEWMRVGMQDGGADIMTKLTPHKPLD